MRKGTGSVSGHFGRSSLFTFLRDHSRGQAAPKPVASLMEELESRLMLSTLPVAHTDFTIHHGTGVNRPFDSASAVGMTPTQLRQAYGINAVQFGSVAGDGTGQTIAIVDAYDDPSIVADLAAFDSAFGLAEPPTFTVIGQNGSSTRPGTDPSGPGNSWAVETSMDVEWAHAVAPKANILLVEANSDSDSDLFGAINTAKGYAGVSVVSMSWGTTEFSGETSYDSYFTTPAGHNGVTFVASSGDSGAYASSYSHTIIANYPSSSPNVVSAGGTYLSTDAGGNYTSETGWGNGTTSGRNGGSGGGISRYETQPAWQKGVVTQSTSYRTTPDVAMDADPNSGVAVYDSYDFGAQAPWAQIGGTSLAAPLWSGVIAIADQGVVLGGGSTFTSAQALTKLYTLPASDFHDITSGNNGYAAGAGYDLVTGRGSPIVNLLASSLAGPTTPTPVISSMTAGPTSGLAGTSVTLTASNVHESIGAPTISTVTFYRESNSTSGLQTAGDTLLGTGTQNGTTWTYSFDTTGLSAGTYTFYATATDSGSVTSAVASTTFKVTLPAPANDSFAGAAVLTGDTVTATGNNATATKETGEPSIAGNQGGKSDWWSWTATSSGKVTVNTKGSTFDTLLGVYTGDVVSALTTVAQNDDVSRSDLTSSLSFTATAGTTYYIAVDGFKGRNGAASGDIVLNVTVQQAPTNDNFANATVLSGASATATGNNSAASKEAGEPNVMSNLGGKSLWYAWTAPTSGTVQINTEGSNFDTVLGVYTGGSVSSLTTVAQNDDVTRRDATSAVSFTAAAGTIYYIQVDGYNSGRGAASGNVVLNLTEQQAPANDNFANATAMSGPTWTGTNTGANTEFGEPNTAGNMGGASVWLAWTAPSNGTATINTSGSNFDTMLGVYTGSAVSSLTTIAQNDDASRRDASSAVTFAATAGTIYYFAVDGYNNGVGPATGNIMLNLSLVQSQASTNGGGVRLSTGTLAGTGSVMLDHNTTLNFNLGSPGITGNLSLDGTLHCSGLTDFAHPQPGFGQLVLPTGMVT